jgi:hypothetical protein
MCSISGSRSFAYLRPATSAELDTLSSMGQVSTAAATVAMIALAAAPAALGHTTVSQGSICSSGHSGVVAADVQAQVSKGRLMTYTVQHEPLERVRVYRGCVHGGRRELVLGEFGRPCSSSGCGTSIASPVLGGTIVAFERSTLIEPLNGEGAGEYFVVVRDLRTGRTLHQLATGPGRAPKPRYKGSGPTTAIVVKPDGAVAWIVDSGIEGSAFEVHAFDKSGSRLLAVGPDIAPTSLALAGSTLYWTQGGTAHSTTLE